MSHTPLFHSDTTPSKLNENRRCAAWIAHRLKRRVFMRLPVPWLIAALAALFVPAQSSYANAPTALVTPSNLTFGNQSVGTTSSEWSVTLANNGNATLHISSINIGGANPSAFSITTQNCGTTLAAGNNCTMGITFSPVAATSYSATLNVMDDAAGSPHSIPLTGTGTALNAFLAPSSLNFVNTTVGVTTSAQPVNLTNSSNGPISISSIAITGTNAANFSQTNNCGVTLAANSSCTIQVTFTAPSAGTFTANLVATDNAASSPQSIPLNANAQGPGALLTPSSLTFGNQSVGATSSPWTETLTNNSGATLHITSIVIGGANPSAFSIATQNCGATLAANSSCTMGITFSPAAATSYSATLIATDDATGSPQSIPLTGTGTALVANLAPSSLNFPNATIGVATGAQTVTFTNSSNGAVTIGSITITGANASAFSKTTTCGVTLAANSSCTISITFTAPSAGSFTANLVVTDNSTGSPHSIPLTGSASALSPMALITPSSLTFGNQTVHATSTPWNVNLTNNGAATLHISSIVIGGPNASAFAFASQTCGATLAANTSCSMGITFTPSATGNYSATLSVTDDASGSPQSIPLTGTGTAINAFLAPSSLNFVNQQVNVTSNSQQVNLDNYSNGPMTISSIAITGIISSAFSYTTNCGSTLAANSACQIWITYTPPYTNTINAYLVVNDDASNSPQSIQLTGNGVTSTPGSIVMDPVINTVAGNGFNPYVDSNPHGGYTGDSGQATSAELNLPNDVAIDKAGNIYIADTRNHVIRRVDAHTGIITTIAGNGTGGYSGDGGAATSAELYQPRYILFDSYGNLLIADAGNNRVRRVDAITGNISTIAGTGAAGFSGDGGPATSAKLNGPFGMAFDAAGNLYIADSANFRVRRVDAISGNISTVAGDGTNAATAPGGFTANGGDGGLATSAGLSMVYGVAFDPSGNLYIADTTDNRIRKVNAITGVITTIAGTGATTFNGDYQQATFANLNDPIDVQVDGLGNILITDTLNNRIRRIDAVTGVITTIVGNGYGNGSWYSGGYAGDGGLPTDAKLFNPYRIALGLGGDIFVADTCSNVIRKVSGYNNNTSYLNTLVTATSASRNVLLQVNGDQTIASITAVAQQGHTPEFTVGSITGCTIDGATTVHDESICVVPVRFAPAYPGLRQVPLKVVASSGTYYFGLSGIGVSPEAVYTPGTITTDSGNGVAGTIGDGNPAAQAELSGPQDVAFDAAGNYYVADTDTSRIRRVYADGSITTVLGYASSPVSLPNQLLIASNGAVFIDDANDNRIEKVNLNDVFSRVAGGGGSSAEGVAATNALLNSPQGIGMDEAGNLYIAEFAGNRIRKVDAATGLITTVAGTGTAGFSGDGGLATSAKISAPRGNIVFDSAGNFYFSDSGNGLVREVSVNGIITTVAGTTSGGSTGDGIPATGAILTNPTDLTIDASGYLYVTDAGKYIVRKFLPGGNIYTIAGTGSAGYSGNSGLATSARLHPLGATLNPAGDLYIADSSNNVVRKVDQTHGLSLSFATTYVFDTSVDSPKTETLWNAGNSLLSFPVPVSGNNPSISAHFALDSGAPSDCPVVSSGAGSPGTLASAANCQLSVSFEPLIAGSISGALVVTDNTLNAAGPAYAQQSFSLNGLARLHPQTITFTLASPVTYGVDPITLTGTASSGLTVAYTVLSGPASVLGNVLTITGAGTVVVAADQPGNLTQWDVAPRVTQTLTVNKQAPTVTVTPAAFTYGDSPTTLSATIAYTGYAGVVAPTGAVSIQVDSGVTVAATCINGVLVRNCSASYNTRSLTGGAHTITVTEATDTNYLGASNTDTLTVNQATPTVTANAATITYGNASATLSASVAYTGVSAPTGAVTIQVDSGATIAAICVGATSPRSCSASYNTSSIPAGPHTITVSLASDTNYIAASNTATLTVNKATPAVTVSPASITYGDTPTTLSASVAYTGASAPTGAATIQVDSGAIVAAICVGATSPLSCSASYTTDSLTAGAHTITVSLAADSNYIAASNTADLTVNLATPTVTVSPASITYGDTPTTLSASVAYTGVSAPSGAVSIQVDSGATLAAICVGASSPLSCTASYTTGSLTGGAHTIHASLASDSNYSAASNTGTLTVTQATPTVTVNPASSTYGVTPTTLTAPVAYTGPSAPSGAVTIQVDSGSTLPASCVGATSPLSCTVSYATGSLAAAGHTITASLASDTNYIAASNTGTLTINQATPAVTVIPSTITYGDTPTTLTAHVAYTGASAPSGAASISIDGGLAIAASCAGASSPLSCTADFATGSLNAAPHTIAAAIASDSNYNSASNSGSLTINQATPSVTITPYTVTYDNNPHTPVASATGVGAVPLAPAGFTLPTHTNAGAYAADAWSFTDASGNYATQSGTILDTINQATPLVTVTPYTVTFDGNPHTPTASATGLGGAPLAPAGFTLPTHTNAGSYAADAWIFTDASGNYATQNGTVADSIAQAVPIVTVTPYSLIYDGNPHTATGSATGVSGPLAAGGFTLTATTHTNAGNYPADVWSFNDISGNYTILSGTVSDAIAQTIPVITWAQPAPVSAGYALDGTVANAGASVLGTFTYTPSLGTVFASEGQFVLEAFFTPTDGTNYTTAHAYVNLDVHPVVVIPGVDYTISATPSPLTLVAGTSGTVILTMTNVGAFGGSVTFDCSNLPAQISCAFNPGNTLTGDGVDGHTTSTALLITASAGSGGTMPAPQLFPRQPILTAGLFVLPALLGGFLLFFKRREMRRATKYFLYLLIAVNLSMFFNGCALVGFKGAAVGMHTITLEAKTTANGKTTVSTGLLKVNLVTK